MRSKTPRHMSRRSTSAWQPAQGTVRYKCDGAHQVTDSPLAMVIVAGTKRSSPPSPPSLTVAALAPKAREREATPARAKLTAACRRGRQSSAVSSLQARVEIWHHYS